MLKLRIPFKPAEKRTTYLRSIWTAPLLYLAQLPSWTWQTLLQPVSKQSLHHAFATSTRADQALTRVGDFLRLAQSKLLVDAELTRSSMQKHPLHLIRETIRTIGKSFPLSLS